MFAGGENIRTYVQEGVPPGEVNIPSFNLPLSLGMRLLLYEYMSEREFLGDEFRNGAQVIVRLPRLAGGEPPPPPLKLPSYSHVQYYYYLFLIDSIVDSIADRKDLPTALPQK